MNIALISPEQVLQRGLANCDYRIVDARPYADYLAGHIPGAVWMGWEDWCEQAPVHANSELFQPGYWGVLKGCPPEFVADSLSQLGLHEDGPILVYADGEFSKGREGRIAWTLLYWGASNVFLLNGGWTKWLQSGGSSETLVPKPNKGHFKVTFHEHRRVSLLQLKEAYFKRSMPVIVDVRSHMEYDGHNFAYQPRVGRLPEALHVPFAEMFDETGNFVNKEIYLQRIPETVHKSDQLVAYCEVGVRSCVFALLHELYTGRVVANFDGSFMEWSLDLELPVEIT